jgi:hypothetical protein
MVDGDDGQACWCAQLPAVVIPTTPDANRTDARCFCPQCLSALLRENPPSPSPDRQ